jgi:hypothetical protein
MLKKNVIGLAGIPALLVFLFAVGSTSGNTVTYDATFGPTQTNWGMGTGVYPSVNLSVPKFSPGLGTLTQVEITLHGQATGTAKFESKDTAASTVTTNLSAKVVVKRPDGTDFIVVVPLASTSDNVTAFDGVIDFGGTSGRTYTNLSGQASESKTLMSGNADFAMFIGNDMIVLPAYAQGTSNSTGSGNLMTSFRTLAQADVTVTYTFIPIPAPQAAAGGLGLLALLAGGITIKRRFRLAQ